MVGVFVTVAILRPFDSAQGRLCAQNEKRFIEVPSRDHQLLLRNPDFVGGVVALDGDVGG